MKTTRPKRQGLLYAIYITAFVLFVSMYHWHEAIEIVLMSVLLGLMAAYASIGPNPKC